MAVAGVLLDVAPGLASALPGHIDHPDRHVEEAVGSDRLEQRPRRAVEAAAGRRARNDLDLALRLPDHGLFAGFIEPSTLAQRSTSLRMNSSKGAGVLLGADRPYQTVSLKSGRPASVVVGTSGSMAERRSPVTA